MTVTQLTKIANKLGYGKLISNATLYNGGNARTFTKPHNGVWSLTIKIVDGLICGIEVNKTYFKETPQVIEFNQLATYENPIDIDEALRIADIV